MPKRKNRSDSTEHERKDPSGRSPSFSITPPPSSQKYNLPKYPLEEYQNDALSLVEESQQDSLSSRSSDPFISKQGSFQDIPTPPKPVKKHKISGHASSSSNSKNAGAFPAEAKKVLVQHAMDLAYRSLPFAELSKELGISESRLKDQFKPNRSNIRKAITDMFL
ncbi:uncharacterized protein I303_100664 [Kwoniella dejecticola CBS 10117]|uniref:Uncharacterized protein n=1 Tax=Kwoniella dejecticola CBS 10117 TaxID=1296121 RepID=A0AAJ8MDV5_9TREE